LASIQDSTLTNHFLSLSLTSLSETCLYTGAFSLPITFTLKMATATFAKTDEGFKKNAA
jgi:hypothetical protein